MSTMYHLMSTMYHLMSTMYHLMSTICHRPVQHHSIWHNAARCLHPCLHTRPTDASSTQTQTHTASPALALRPPRLPQHQHQHHPSPGAPVLNLGGRGTIQPSSHALSMMDTSMDLMDTGSWLMPSTQAPSQGAGHTRPVNSGKLLVSSRRSRASRQRPLCTRSLNSGTLLPSGQPGGAGGQQVVVCQHVLAEGRCRWWPAGGGAAELLLYWLEVQAGC
jgi:hypothetical protein